MQVRQIPFPSPPRLTERGEEGEADTTGTPPAPCTCADEAELRLPPDPPEARLLPLLPSPPRPADGAVLKVLENLIAFVDEVK
jgi:hypothetical protein